MNFAKVKDFFVPAENAKKASFFLKLPFSSKNRSGVKVNGSEKYFGSCRMKDRGTNTSVPCKEKETQMVRLLQC